MQDQHLHIVTHDVPYPADFGGVVDLFYKIKWLYNIGIKIHLHCFLSNRCEQEELKKYCVSVNYYKRKKFSGISFSLPYIVYSRRNKKLLKELQNDQYPILLEGIHCSYYLHEGKFTGRKVFLRLHNVEYRYYEQLAKYENNFFKKLYYIQEAKLLKKYENKIANKVPIWTVSSEDIILYKEQFASKNIQFIPVFLPYEQVQINDDVGSYCLYHGNLSINENEIAALWLMEEIFNTMQIPLIIAGRNPSKKLKDFAEKYTFVSVVENPTEVNMQLLIQSAQINILPSFNKTGVKFKLLNALYNGRHCIVNQAGIVGSGLNDLCFIEETADGFIEKIHELFTKPFTVKEMQYRGTALKKLYNNRQNALIISDMIQ